MKKLTLLLVAALLLSAARNSNLYAAETNAPAIKADSSAPQTESDLAAADLKDLVSRINQKLQNDKTNEADLAGNLQEFDGLVAKHKNAKPEDRALILGMKGRLYLQVLNQPEKALAVYQQIKNDFPSTVAGGHIDKIIAGIQGIVDHQKASAALAPGALFPDFNEKDVDGNALSISQYKGKVVLVDFWATWCPPCVAKVPEIQSVYNKYHDKGLEIVGISLDEEKSRLQQFTQQKKMPWPQYFDGKRWENKLAVKYGVDATPTAYLLDRQGKIIAKLSGEEDLDSEIAQALKK